MPNLTDFAMYFTQTQCILYYTSCQVVVTIFGKFFDSTLFGEVGGYLSGRLRVNVPVPIL